MILELAASEEELHSGLNTVTLLLQASKQPSTCSLGRELEGSTSPTRKPDVPAAQDHYMPVYTPVHITHPLAPAFEVAYAPVR
jgi:hypothetical protein